MIWKLVPRAKLLYRSTGKHKFNTRRANSASMRSYFVPENSALTDKITAAELCKVYHAVYHHQSYRSLDYGIKLDRELYAYSSVAKGVTCGRTKAQSLCKTFLPHIH